MIYIYLCFPQNLEDILYMNFIINVPPTLENVPILCTENIDNKPASFK